MERKERIGALVASDRGGRKVPALFRPSFLDEALRLMEASSKVAVTTGFFVSPCGAPETDGPGGAVMLARALERCGREVSLFTDALCFDVVEACSKSVNGPSVRCVFSGEHILEYDPDLLVYIERIGRAEDGKYYNMRGEDVSSVTIPLDDAAFLALERNIPVLAVGDGGNEAGMGNFRGDLAVLLPSYAPCLSVVEASVALPVDVSDWGGYALASLLSLRREEWIGPEEDEIDAMLNAMVSRGAVDGVTRRREPTVDDFPLEEHRRIVRSLRETIIFSVLRS